MAVSRVYSVENGTSGFFNATPVTTAANLFSVVITSPGNLTFVKSDTVLVTGTVSDRDSRVTVNGILATSKDGIFSSLVPLNEGDNLLVAVAQDATGRTATASVQITLDTTDCPTPVILDFSADPLTLPKEGTATLYWSTSLADTVAVSTKVQALAPEGSLDVNLNTTTAYRLEATNLCGTAARTITVAVGNPGTPSIWPRSAQPGQPITITPANTSEPDRITGAVFAFPDSRLVPVEEVTRSGEIIVKVPFQKTTTEPGYFTGSVNVSLIYLDPVAGAAVPLTVTRFTYSGDAVADFRSLVEDVARRTNDALEQQKNAPELSQSASALQNLARDYTRAILKALDDVAATGSAKMLESLLPRPEDPNSPTVTLTRSDLQLAMSLSQSGSMDPLSRVLAAQEQEPQRFADRSPPCLSDDILYWMCRRSVEIGEDFHKGLSRLGPLGPGVESIATLSRWIMGLSLLGTVPCQLQPVVLDRDNFRVAKPSPIPATKVNPTEGSVELHAILRPNFRSLDELLKYIESKLLGKLKVPFADQIKPVVDFLDRFRRDLANALIAPIPKTFAEKQVFHCDLDNVRSKTRARLERFSGVDKGGLFGFAGRQPGTATIGIQVRDGSFIREFGDLRGGDRARELYILGGRYYGKPEEEKTNVQVEAPPSSLHVYWSPVTVGIGDRSQYGGWQERLEVLRKINTPQGFEVTLGRPWVPRITTFGGAWGVQSVRQTDKNTWVVHQKFGTPSASCLENSDVSNDSGYVSQDMRILLRAVQPQQVTLQIKMEGPGPIVTYEKPLQTFLTAGEYKATAKIAAGTFGELYTLQGYGNSCKPSSGKTTITIKMVPEPQ